MAKYTVELGDVIKSGSKIFDFDYKFYNETMKPDFEKKFINHFYFREIGSETVGRFKHYLKCKFDETLPYYNMLFTTAQVEYDLLNNYNLTETLTKTRTNEKGITGSANQSGTTDDQTTTSGNKTSLLDSKTDHTESVDYSKTETTEESGLIDKIGNTLIEDKKVGSDTPNALLSMIDIKTNVYASKADIQDAKTDTTDKQTSSGEKTNTLTEETNRTTSDNVDASSQETNSQTTSGESSIQSNTTTNQNETGNENENYNLTRIGNIGVQTGSDMLMKHIELQRTLTTIELQFFKDCEDLFMQIF